MGDSMKDVETMLGANAKRHTRSAAAREFILAILEGEGEQESDALDARVANATGLTAGTVRQLRAELKNEGLVKSFPQKDEFGEILRWLVACTQAPSEGVL